MIREWLATWRRRARAGVGPALDTAVFLGAQFDFAAAQMEGLRDALAEAEKKLDEEKAARAQDNALFRAALTRYVTAELTQVGGVRWAGLMEHMGRPARERERGPAYERTVVTAAEELRRARPVDAPTEQYRRPR